MTINQLNYVITVADSRSMNEAAKTLFISQPSLSAAIRELETEIGIEIFRRNNRGVSVTPEGMEFLGYARQVVEQYELIQTRYVDHANVKKRFSVSMQHYSFAVDAFVKMVKQFGMDEYEFAVHETKTFEVIEDVKNFKSELGILYINDFNRKVLTKLFNDYDLEFLNFLSVESMFISGRDILWQKRKSYRLRNLRSIRVFHLSRVITIPSTLRRRFSVHTSTRD